MFTYKFCPRSDIILMLRQTSLFPPNSTNFRLRKCAIARESRVLTYRVGSSANST
jgi:hypothetical protein